MEKVIAHVDMDCFFAACEEKKDPSLKGKPLIIGALPEDCRGVVSTANYEARKYGVHSAMPISKAHQLCPSAKYKRPDSIYYKNMSEKAMNALSIFALAFEQVSIDEAYLDITEFSKECLTLQEAARKIKKEVLKETGLTCSIGISCSRYISKIASDYRKPAGTTIVRDVKSFLAPLKISKIPGIGKKSSRKLISYGIKKIGDLAESDTFFLIENFGKSILKLKEIAKGNNNDGVNHQERKRKSASREITFKEDIELESCRNYLSQLSYKVVEDIKKGTFKTISIKMRFEDFSTITRDFSLNYRSSRQKDIIDHSLQLLEKIKIDKKVRLLGVKVSNLDFPKSRQMELDSYC
ncbi:MAG: DNA polymerase IV [Nanobdellota archaeon]